MHRNFKIKFQKKRKTMESIFDQNTAPIIILPILT